MRRYWAGIGLVTVIAHGPFAAGTALCLERVPGGHGLALSMAVILAVLVRGRFRHMTRDRRLSAIRVLLEEMYFAHWCGAVLSLLPFAVGCSLFAILLRTGSLGRWIGVLGAVCYAVSVAISAYAVFVRRTVVLVRTLELCVPGLPAEFDGYRVGHVSDLHIGSLTPRSWAERWCQNVNALDLDLLVLTGDYVTSGDAFHEDIANAVGRLSARDGVFAVLGNHDTREDDGRLLVERLEQRGVVVLRNRHRVVRKGAALIVIGGVDDNSSSQANISSMVKGMPGGAPVIALAHNPMLFPQLEQTGAALVLSGHTHWGQLAVPFCAVRYNLARLSYRYHAGLYRRGESLLYVSSGVGTTGPPARLGAAPEIAVLRLRTKLPDL